MYSQGGSPYTNWRKLSGAAALLTVGVASTVAWIAPERGPISALSLVSLPTLAFGALGGALALTTLLLAVFVRRERTAVRKRAELLWDVALHLPLAALYMSGEHVRLNEAAQRLTGYRDDEIETVDDWFRLTRGERAAEARRVYEQERATRFARTSRRRIQTKDGRLRDLEFMGYLDGSGELWIFHDVTEDLSNRAELVEANRILAELAATDPLTGLMNRRAFDQGAAVLFEQALDGLPLSALLVDVDHFKAVNDNFGHDAGDEALREVARVLTWAIREDDVAARYGGEEFVVLLPKLNEPAALAVAERIRKAVEEASFEHGTTTVSVGVATHQEGIDSMRSLLQAADQALYEAKRGGRNQVCLA